MAATLIVPVVDEGPSNSAYLVDLGDGRALAVDVPRDLRAVRAAARRHGLSVAPAPAPAPLTTGQVRALQDEGGQVIDVRLVSGTLSGGMSAWGAAGQPAAATPLLTPGRVDPAAVIDVRQAGEYAGGHLPGARNIELGALTSQAAGMQGRPVVVMCGHGERAATAASVLERAGHTGVAVVDGGPPDWANATGQALELNE